MASGHLFVLLHSWVSSRRIGLVHVEKALCVFNRNDYEPDIVFFGPDKAEPSSYGVTDCSGDTGSSTGCSLKVSIISACSISSGLKPNGPRPLL